MINSVILQGNLVRDPEHRVVGEHHKATFRMASNRRGKDGEEYTTFVDVETWRACAEFVARNLRKGDQVCVAGRLDQADWETDGQRRSKLYVSSRDVQIVRKKGDA